MVNKVIIIIGVGFINYNYSIVIQRRAFVYSLISTVNGLFSVLPS